MNYSYMDCLAELGIGGAHPGGLPLTKQLLSQVPIQDGTTVLDAGCGTGRSSAYVKEHFACQVTALDNHQTMVKKAKQRFLSHNLPIEVQHGSTESLPFEKSTFDIILSESVIAFTDASRTVNEFSRVLKPTGVLLAVEMVVEKAIPMKEVNEIKEFYGLSELLTVDEWDSLFQQAGFQDRKILTFTSQFDAHDPDHAPEFLLSENLDDVHFDILKEHEQLIEKYKDVLGYRMFRCTV
ncbi:methyltransferase domain-containing protein [Ornithinibacillus sp. L9]|uniref:Methyltransferase domain-containing protein n=1 Tax=Ornithinibacillus caprae TaxID=2678566 RepID=A0A6N8FQ72_9BACI|nr:class I SAM-dependent methyltransferase [Ornithinibacillus caprae]MUK90417.1 methyltransferase domain-containing protein [Ornithinibacillus caprae]